MEEKETAQNPEGAPRRLFQDEKSNLNTSGDMATNSPRRWWKAGIVLALIFAVVLLVVVKKEDHRPAAGGLRRTNSASLPSFPAETVLATVSGEEIRASDLEEFLSQMPLEYRAEYARQQDLILDELITRLLLLQEARRRGIEESDEYRTASAAKNAQGQEKEDVLINVLLKKEVIDKVDVADDEVRKFYEENRARFDWNTSFEQVEASLRGSLLQQKQYQKLEEYVTALRDKASITRNETWLEVQRRIAGENPLDRALAAGKPVLADFGRGTCIPCKMMKPILDELTEELKGRVSVLILDTSDYGYLARRYRIRIIPTQIFFDGAGGEVFRHEGFISKEDILAKLRALSLLEG